MILGMYLRADRILIHRDPLGRCLLAGCSWWAGGALAGGDGWWVAAGALLGWAGGLNPVHCISWAG